MTFLGLGIGVFLRHVIRGCVWTVVLTVVVSGTGFAVESHMSQDQSPGVVTLEDFRQSDEAGFPQGWEAQRSKATAQKAHTIREENGITFLEAKGATQRIYTKHISWDPKRNPILRWRWRVRSIPEDAEFVAAVYPSLDVDLLFIPVNTKYVWSLKREKGTVTEGGFFRPTEVVIRSGSELIGEWVEEQVNVYEDFKQIHQHEPASKAWGISLLGGPGVEIDFGPLEAHTP